MLVLGEIVDIGCVLHRRHDTPPYQSIQLSILGTF